MYIHMGLSQRSSHILLLCADKEICTDFALCFLGRRLEGSRFLMDGYIHVIKAVLLFICIMAYRLHAIQGTSSALVKRILVQKSVCGLGNNELTN